MSTSIGYYLHEANYYRQMVGLSGLASALLGRVTRNTRIKAVTHPDARHPFYVRLPSSDISTFDQIFLKQEYDFPVRGEPKTIIDAGANIGLASVYLANRFPDAKIIAIEPDKGNFDIMQRNLAPYPNVVGLCAALWHRNEEINLVDPGKGEWSFRTEAKDAEHSSGQTRSNAIPGMTVERIMAEQGIEHIDVLKIDIEGSEYEVFEDPSAWLGRVDALIVELHERLKPGCDARVEAATADFEQSWRQGENIYITRERGCLVPGSSDY